jgi:hypothetical protein
MAVIMQSTFLSLYRGRRLRSAQGVIVEKREREKR